MRCASPPGGIRDFFCHNSHTKPYLLLGKTVSAPGYHLRDWGSSSEAGGLTAENARLIFLISGSFAHRNRAQLTSKSPTTQKRIISRRRKPAARRVNRVRRFAIVLKTRTHRRLGLSRPLTRGDGCGRDVPCWADVGPRPPRSAIVVTIATFWCRAWWKTGLASLHFGAEHPNRRQRDVRSLSRARASGAPSTSRLFTRFDVRE